MRISDWSSDVCSSDLPGRYIHVGGDEATKDQWKANPAIQAKIKALGLKDENALQGWFMARIGAYLEKHGRKLIGKSEEHTSELQSLMRISYAVFCLKQKTRPGAPALQHVANTIVHAVKKSQGFLNIASL